MGCVDIFYVFISPLHLFLWTCLPPHPQPPACQQEMIRAFEGDSNVGVIASYAALDSINDGAIDRLRGSFYSDSSCLEHD